MRKYLGSVFKDREMWDLYLTSSEPYEYEVFNGRRTVVLSEETVVEFIDSGAEWLCPSSAFFEGSGL